MAKLSKAGIRASEVFKCYEHRSAHCVYAIICSKTQKLYIGSTINLGNRLAQHLSDLVSGKHFSKRLQADWDNYTESDFYAKVLEEVDLTDDLYDVEQMWIIAICPELPEKGYNRGWLACAYGPRKPTRPRNPNKPKKVNHKVTSKNAVKSYYEVGDYSPIELLGWVYKHLPITEKGCYTCRYKDSGESTLIFKYPEKQEINVVSLLRIYYDIKMKCDYLELSRKSP